MINHFFMGALNKLTNKYEYPTIANKMNSYKCPECDNDVIFKKGKIKQPHFSHKKSNKPCHYYDRPSESQIHLNAKMAMKSLLDENQPIIFCRECDYCCKNYDILNINYVEHYEVILEYRFNYNNSRKSADVAYIENNKIKYIFEICNTNKTKENDRPEPWVEIDAETLVKYINSKTIGSPNKIQCIRNYKCDSCVDKHAVQIERNREHQELTNMINEEMKQRKYELDEKNKKIKLEQDKQRLEYEKFQREENERYYLEQKNKYEMFMRECEEKKQNELLLKTQQEEQKLIEKQEKRQKEYEDKQSKGLICHCNKPAIAKRHHYECPNKPFEKCNFRIEK